jgi:hypothetical protein
VNRKFDRVKASYQEVYNDMLQYIFTVTGLYTINMKIKCKSNKFNEFNRYGSDEKNSTLVIGMM